MYIFIELTSKLHSILLLVQGFIYMCRLGKDNKRFVYLLFCLSLLACTSWITRLVTQSYFPLHCRNQPEAPVFVSMGRSAHFPLLFFWLLHGGENSQLTEVILWSLNGAHGELNMSIWFNIFRSC